MEQNLRSEWQRAAYASGNKRYGDALDAPDAVSIISRINELVLLAELDYDWQTFEAGQEEVDLKQRLLYGPKSRPILPKLSKHGRVIDPGGRWNVIPLEGGLVFRTVSTPRFDGYGRFKGSDPQSWIISTRPPKKILDSVLSKVEPLFQVIINTLDLAEL